MAKRWKALQEGERAERAVGKEGKDEERLKYRELTMEPNLIWAFLLQTIIASSQDSDWSSREKGEVFTRRFVFWIGKSEETY